MSFSIFVLVMGALAAGTMSAVLVLGRSRWLAVIAAVGGATAVLIVYGLYLDYYADDAYITLRYSRHLADGLGPNWNSAGRVEGYTSFSWMALLAGLGKLGVDLVEASRVLGFLSLLATFLAVVLIWQLWRDEDPESGAASPVVLAAALLGLALADGTAFWGFSGMETPLFMALVTASAYFYLRERRGALVPWSAVVLAATAMTRPEGLIVAAVTGLFVLADAVREPDRGRAVRRLFAWAGVFIALYGSYFIWRYSYFGYLLPNTYYAKVGLTSASIDRGFRLLADQGLQLHLLAMFVGLAVLAVTKRFREDGAYIAAVVAALLAGFVVEGGGDANNRFLLPLLPLLLLGGLAGLAIVLRQAALGGAQTFVVAALALSLGGLALLPSAYDPLLGLGQRGIEQRSTLGAWFNVETPEDYTIADFQIGAISYFASDRDFLDLLGLNDVVIAHTDISNMGAGVPGHEKYNVDYVLDVVRPEITNVGQVRREPLSAAELRERLLQTSLLPASSALFADPRLWERYQVRALELDGRWFHFLQRKDTVDELQALGLQ